MDVAAAVLRAAKARADALASRDPASLLALLHPDFRWTTHTGDVLLREQYVEQNTQGELRWRGQRLQDPAVVHIADTAVLVATVVDDVQRGDQREEFRMPVTQTWVRVEASWLCLAGHAGPRL